MISSDCHLEDDNGSLYTAGTTDFQMEHTGNVYAHSTFGGAGSATCNAGNHISLQSVGGLPTAIDRITSCGLLPQLPWAGPKQWNGVLTPVLQSCAIFMILCG